MNPPQLLFLHGFGENHQVWDDFLPNFEWKYAIHCPNYADWTDCLTLEDYAVKIMSNLPYQSFFYVLGHSMGGYIALELVKLFPDKIVKVVMLNSSAFPDSDQKKLNRDKTIQFLRNFGTEKFIDLFIPNLFSPEFSTSQPEILAQLIQRYQSLSPDGLMAATLAMKNRMDGRELLKITCVPFLFIHGKQDALIALEDIQACVDINTSLHQLAIFDQTGHQATYEEPQNCMEKITQFLNLNNG
jgi:pimeloyl-ACP methyl ester carboxylesterase